MKKIEAGEKHYSEWIKENLPKDTKIGIDPQQMPAGSFLTRKDMFEKEGISLIPTETNLIDDIWKVDEENPKPEMPKEPVWVLDDKYTG